MRENLIKEITDLIKIENSRKHNRNIPNSYYEILNDLLEKTLIANKSSNISKNTSIRVTPYKNMKMIFFLGASKKSDLFEQLLVGTYLENDKHLIFSLICAYDDVNDILYIDSHSEDVVNIGTWNEMLCSIERE